MTNPLMEYLPPLQQQPQAPQQRQAYATGGALKYQNPEIAKAFDAKRKDDPKRVISKNAVKAMLEAVTQGALVLDAGCGTGLMFNYFVERGFNVLGVDLSQAMLDEAGKKLDAHKAAGRLKSEFRLARGSILGLPIAEKAFDASVMIDLTRWLSPSECQKALQELQRVTKSRIIWTARIANHKDARTVELFEAVLDGWKITGNVAGEDVDYRILMAEPT